MRYVSGSACISQGAYERNKRKYPYKVLEPYGEWKWEHKHFLIAKKHVAP